jgi:ELWxxDGT repeat protein
LFTLRDRVLFVADDGTHGLELWETDGGAPGTRIVADACPGACSSWAREFTRLGDVMLFQATDGVHGAELWRTDGTAAGTRMVLDLRPGPDGGAPTRFVRLGDELLLDVVAADGGHELWTTDGTPTGTRLVRELSPPGARTGGFWLPAGGFAYLVLDDGATGREIWTTDGSSAGTTLLADICPGSCNGVADFSGAMVGGLLFFAGRNAADAPLELRAQGRARPSRPRRS